MRPIPMHDRVPRLRSLKTVPPGFVEMVRCASCGHLAPLPLAQMIAKFGEDQPIEWALFHIKCARCGLRKAERKRMRLCDPACAQQRG